MRTKLSMTKRLGLVVAAVATVAAITTTAGPAQAAPAAPLTPSSGVLTLTTPSGDSATTFGITLPVTPGNRCAGDGVTTPFYRWAGFITPIANDPSQLQFNGAGGTPNTTVSPGSLPLSGSSGFVLGQTPASGTGAVTPPVGLSFANPLYSPSALPAGQYNIGIACYELANGTATNSFWATPITIARPGGGPNNLVYGQPAVPAAPVLTTPNAFAPTPTVNFTQAPAIPSVSGYTATLTQTAPTVLPPVSIAVAAGATSIPLPALTLGSTYTLSMVATNTGTGGGNSVASTPLLILTPSTTAPAPIPITVPNPFERAGFNIGWTVPATGPTPDNYTVQIFTAAPTAGAPALVTTFPIVSGTTVAVPAGPAAPTAPTYAVGNYTARVTANYTTSPGVTATAGNQAFSVTPSTLIFQEITVERPPGALVLTQRCGVYGDLPAFGPVVGFPGFPRLVAGQLPVASTAGVDERPDTDVDPAGDRTIGQYTPDGNFLNYPEIGTYPSECGLDMGVARLVTSGTLAGQFYTASGRLNQVTVLDTRDVDAGWTAKGDIDNLFQQGSGGTGLEFAGNYLGWVPIVTDDSDPVGGSTYNQTVVAGLPVLPGTGTSAAPPPAGFNTTGLQDAPTLALAAGGAGLGIATLDARMNLLIPASIDRGTTGTYTATLSLTVA